MSWSSNKMLPHYFQKYLSGGFFFFFGENHNGVYITLKNHNRLDGNTIISNCNQNLSEILN